MEPPWQGALRHPTDANAHESVASSAPAAESYVYACRKCRRVLFRQQELVPHDAEPGSCGNKGFKQRGGGHASQQQQREVCAAREGEVCTSYFLDPDVSPWVAEESREVHQMSGGADVLPDTIYCPNRSCRAKIGTQSWVGSQCSCGAWVAPAFKIHSRVVDKMPAV
ncbi:dual specificity phosphatase 12 [Trypanosoma conorhini]|uniref:Dual specificity phosphatase 12 n=1 Tax=Trypanosoma conorhini TaxID=83891 RepID=A0A3R7NZ13_9TRYP|nr:dual specificity phosphatase 12 [Trypanosoma conorhini]RNF26066.1 dual specificity phosphatase 12 [Trypanosoma conorhini]